ncbi:MAG: ABC transporter ATP-binding protein [Bacilli bacterium]
MLKNNTHIKIEHVKKIYPNGFEAVHDFNLEIKDNEFVVFVGPSGCGKSTMLRMIAGLEEISDGELYIDDEILNDVDPKDRNVAMVFQNYALYPHLTVKKNITFPLTNKRIPLEYYFSLKYRKNRKKEINEIVNSAAEIIGLKDRLDSYPKNLSGGQRQRVALGRAIVRKPKVFLLDEPLSNLDAKMRGQMRSEITNLHKKLNTVFIYVTHDQIEAMTMGDKIVVMKDGYIQQVSSPDELFLHPVNKFVAGFIGTPPMNFIDAKIDEDKNLLFDEIKFVTSKDLKNKIKDEYINKEVYLGIRPKAIYLENDYLYKEQSIKSRVDLCEHLGEDCLIYCSLINKKEKLIISTSIKNKVVDNQEISLSFDESSIYLFSKDDEKALF